MNELTSPSSVWPYLLGYGYAIFAGWLCIKATTDTLWRLIGWRGRGDNRFRPDDYGTATVGIVERILFITVLLLQAPLLIAVWLVIKVAAQYKGLGDDTRVDDSSNRTIPGTAAFQIFLVGNALSIVFAAVGYALVTAQAAQREITMGGAFGLAVLCVGLIVFAERSAAKSQKPEPRFQSGPSEQTTRRRRFDRRGPRTPRPASQ